MKTKGGSLYEVLKSASRPNGADDGAPTSPEPPATPASEAGQPTLQERLAAYKAAKLAAAAQSAAVPAPAPAPELSKPSSTTLVLEPDPTPIPAPTLTRVAPPPPPPASLSATPDPASMVEVPPKGLGERVVRLTYNTVLFGGMVAVGLLFIAYAVGLHVGKSNAAAEFLTASEIPRPAVKPLPAIVQAPAPQPPPPPPLPKKEYTIRLGEWKFVSAQDRLKALALADDPDLKKALERSGHRSFEKTMIRRGSEERLALYVDRFPDLNSDAAKSALTAMKIFKWKNQTPFAQAAFEEAPPR
jgi:hypothetical protein